MHEMIHLYPKLKGGLNEPRWMLNINVRLFGVLY